MSQAADCKVCRNPERRRLIDASYAEGLSAAAISRRQEETGFAITSATVVRHLRQHYVEPVAPGVAKSKKDLAILVQERTLDWLEKTDAEGEPIGPDHPNWKNALAPGLAAQKILDTRAARSDDRKLAFLMAQALLGGGAPVPPQLVSGVDDEDEDVIEGEAIEV